MCQRCKELVNELLLAKKVLTGMERREKKWRENLRDWCNANVPGGASSEGPDILIDG